MSRQEILERERRWRMPTVIAAVVGVALLVASGLVQGGALQGDTQVEQAASIHSHEGSFLFGSVLAALGFLALIGPLLYVFQAARARSSVVKGAMIGFVFLGPVLMAGQTLVQTIGFKNVAAEYATAAENAPPPLQDPGGELSEQAGKDGKDGSAEKPASEQADASAPALPRELGSAADVEEVTFYPGADAYEVETSDGTFRTVEFKSDAEDEVRDRLEGEDFTFTEEEDGDPGDAQLEALREDSGLFTTSLNLLIPAFIALIVAIFYTSLQAMRTGLFTRFFGTLCMALAVAILLLGTLLPTLIVFLAGVALVILGRTPRGLPPAWKTGEAMPWPKPGEEEARGASDVLEGDAAEIDPDDDAGAENPNSERRQRAKRKKRKRR